MPSFDFTFGPEDWAWFKVFAWVFGIGFFYEACHLIQRVCRRKRK